MHPVINLRRHDSKERGRYWCAKLPDNVFDGILTLDHIFSKPKDPVSK